MDILENLNPQQKEAVTTTEGPLLIIAGAGTGKTSVITRRIAYLIEKKLAKPHEILALTFTEKAAAEMEERVDVLVPYGYIDTWISTFHAFGDRLLREKALEIGLPTDFQVLTRPQQVLFFQQNLFAFDLNYYRPLANPTKHIEALLSFISRCKDEDISPEQYRAYVEKLQAKSAKLKPGEEKEELEDEIKRQTELANAYDQYERLKTAAGKIDYGDQVLMTLNLLRTHKKVLKDYQQKFKYILVDEYQDTNYAQNELVKILASGHHNICVVGDDDQSIYKFRGAAISNILEFKNSFPKASQVVLTTNYRSTQKLLDTSYRLIRFNDPDRLEVKNNINKKLLSGRKVDGVEPKLITCQTLSEEADFVASEIEKLVKYKHAYKDIAILVRANSQADPFLRSLNIKNIPHKFVGFSGLYNQPEVKILISLLVAISNFDDSLNLYNLAASDIYNLPLEDCIACMDYARRSNKTLHWVFNNFEKIEEIEVSASGVEIIKRLNQHLSDLMDLSRRENVGKVLYEFLRTTEYIEKLEKEGEGEAATKIQNVAKFFDKIKEFINLAQNETTRAFVEYLETMRASGDDPSTAAFDPDTDAVNILTVHAAKGLEFPTVFMVGLVDDRFPSRERSEPIGLPDDIVKEVLPSGDYHIQEERRLFYVGSTRAKDSLYYTWSHDAGGKRMKKVSPFVLEALDRPIIEVSQMPTSYREKIEQFAGKPIVKLPGKKVDVIRLSQASVDDYETCAYKYRYAHVLRVPILRHHTVIYGSALHQTVATFYRHKLAGKNPTLDTLYEALENSWVSEGFLTAEHEERRLNQARQVIKSFWNQQKAVKDLPTAVEKEFRFNLEAAGTKVLVSGRFDRIDEKGDEVRIIDFKSTEGRSQEELVKDAKASIQLKVYTLGFYKNDEAKRLPTFVGIHDLATGLVGGYSPKQEDLEKTENEIIEVAKSIKGNLETGIFPANPKYFGRVPACNYCAFSSICPFSLAKN